MLRYVLLSDGTSDRSILPILDWVLRAAGLDEDSQTNQADPGAFLDGTAKLAGRVQETLRLYPCDLLFVHRDAEAQPAQKRYVEIEQAVATVGGQQHIGVVPVRMTEAWLLLDESAIRRAAGNPNGTVKLDLLSKKQWETCPDPKAVLHGALRTATELSTRRRRQFSAPGAAGRVAQLVRDFSSLRGLPSFDALEKDVREFLVRRRQVVKQEGMNL